MKLIDLLNKIANRKEVPKMIEYKGEKYKKHFDNYTYWKVGSSESDTLNIDTYDLNIDINIIEGKIYNEADVDILKWGDVVINDLTNDNDNDYDLDTIKKYLAMIMKNQNRIIDHLKENENEK